MSERIHWTKIYETVNNEQAEVIRAYLESNGLEVFLKGEMADELFPGLEFTPVEIMVPEEQKEQAEKLIQRYLEADTDREEN